MHEVTTLLGRKLLIWFSTGSGNLLTNVQGCKDSFFSTHSGEEPAPGSPRSSWSGSLLIMARSPSSSLLPTQLPRSPLLLLSLTMPFLPPILLWNILTVLSWWTTRLFTTSAAGTSTLIVLL